MEGALLIRFTVSNYLSFKEPAALNMVKSLERQLPNHVCEDKISGFQTLRGAVIYGPNASGKSNLVSAIKDASGFILGRKGISQHRAFRLSKKNLILPSSFEFEFTVENTAYAYGFETLNGDVVKEWLNIIKFKKKDKLVFSREVKDGQLKVQTGPALEKVMLKSMSGVELLLKTAPKDSLIVTDLATRQVGDEIPNKALAILIAPFNWCSKYLTVLDLQNPQPQFELVERMKTSDIFRGEINKVLERVDRGIKKVELRVVDTDIKSFAKDVGLGDVSFFQKWEEEAENAIVLVSSPNNRRRYVITKEKDNYTIERMVIVRLDVDRNEIEFELNEESEGTRRIIDLVPIFLRQGKYGTVIIDEMERSLHPEITRMFHDLHYEKAVCQNRQLIIATHEHHLLSQDFYRRDEVWFTQKDKNGETELYSLSDFDGLRFDKDVRKDYLLGRYGAIPNI